MLGTLSLSNGVHAAYNMRRGRDLAETFPVGAAPRRIFLTIAVGPTLNPAHDFSIAHGRSSSLLFDFHNDGWGFHRPRRK